MNYRNGNPHIERDEFEWLVEKKHDDTTNLLNNSSFEKEIERGVRMIKILRGRERLRDHEEYHLEKKPSFNAVI